MDKNEELRIVEEMQAVAAQMRADDIEENPDCAQEYFDCDSCGESKSLAGSIGYRDDLRLCNDCVLIAETGFALGRLKTVADLIEAMEEKRLENICEFIQFDKAKQNN